VRTPRPPRATRPPKENARTRGSADSAPATSARMPEPATQSRRPRIPSCFLYLSKDQPGAREQAPAQIRFEELRAAAAGQALAIAPGTRYVGRVSDGFKTLFVNSPDRSRRSLVWAVRARIQARSGAISGARDPPIVRVGPRRWGLFAPNRAFSASASWKFPKQPVQASLQARAAPRADPTADQPKPRRTEHDLEAGPQGRPKVMIFDMCARSAPSGRSPRSANSPPRSWRT
jgi:hypothetical protein